MCGIVCAFELKQPSEELRPQVLGMSKVSVTEVRIGVVFFQIPKPLWRMSV